MRAVGSALRVGPGGVIAGSTEAQSRAQDALTRSRRDATEDATEKYKVTRRDKRKKTISKKKNQDKRYLPKKDGKLEKMKKTGERPKANDGDWKL